VNDANTTTEDNATTGTVATNDSDLDGDSLSFAVVTNTSKGTITLNVNGSYTYTPNANFNGTDTLTYKVCDNGTPSLCDTAILVITVTPSNDAPVAVNDANTTTEDNATTGTVATNDSDLDGDALSFSTIRTTNNGTLILIANGNYTYTPNANFNGTDTLVYKVCDNGTPSLCDTAILVITVTPVNDPPIAINDSKSTQEDIAVSGTVATNDSDVDGDDLTFGVIKATKFGTLTLLENGTYNYTPNANFNGKDTLVYKVCDNGTPSLCDTAILVITITPENDPPVAVNDVNRAEENETILNFVSNNDFDIDGDVLTYSVLQETVNGIIKLALDGSYTYTPNLDYHGTDTMIYVVCDNAIPSLCDTAMLVITINPNNDPPLALNDEIITPEDNSVSNTVASNDSDPNADKLSFGIISSTKHGNITLSIDGLYTYTPNLNYFGKDTLVYQVCDDEVPSLCDTALLLITVTPVNDPPIAFNDAKSTFEDTPVTFNIIDNDIDIDGTLDHITLDLDPGTPGKQATYYVNGKGLFVAFTDGDITFTPDPNFVGNVDAIRYTIADNEGLISNLAAISVDITPVNDPPTAINDTVSTPINVAITIDASINDFDVDQDALSFTFFDAQNGSVNRLNSGVLTYTPAINFVGTDSLMYTVCDNASPSLCDTAYVFVNVIGIPNTPPVAVKDVFTIPENTTLNESIALNDWDPENNAMAFDWVIKPGRGAIVMNADGSYSYTPEKDFVGVDSFTYVVCDNGLPSMCDTNICVINIINTPKPSIGISMYVDEPVPTTTESYRLTYNITIKNYGDIDLNRLRITDKLFEVFKSPSLFEVEEVIVGQGLTANPNFDGVNDIELLNPNASYIASGESRTIKLNVLVTPNLPVVKYDNIVFAYGNMVYGDSLVSDISVDGFTPDPNADNIPDENSVTSVTITMFVPTGFSPDGDGVNDGFVIKGIENYPLNKLEIFNRWGNKVYEKAPYDNSWSGNTQNSAGIIIGQGTLPNGTYFYVLDFGVEGVKPITGYIVIKK
jgi:large repetitive protein